MYKNPVPTVDIIAERDGKIVIITRGIEPHKGKLANPGGHVDYGETIENAAVREMKEETGLDIRLKGILGVYSDPERDPRRHTITVAFLAEVIGGKLEAGDDAREVGFYEVEKLKKEDFAFDHWKIIQDYVKWKQNGGTYWSSK
ncbi:MAG: NUDIX hydrolase [archaeon]|nr:MAG: NUDIX hydrolase [archaeon]